ncbi:MAG: hypothetical protein WBO19_16820, partial [Terriglobia bacterium]
LQGIDDWQHRRQQEMARVTFDASQHEMLDVSLSESTDRGVAPRKMLSFLELVREEVKQRTFRQRQYAVVEPLYRGMIGWRQGLIFGLLHRFSDPLFVPDEREHREYAELLRESGYQPPGEPEYQELLRLLEEEIASVREEFAYAQKANEERAAIERDACLAPEGETWKTMLRQEAALDHSIDRKVRILLRLRKDAADRPVAPASQDQDDGVRMESTEEVVESDISAQAPQSAEAVEDLKLNDRCGDVIENKGSSLDNREASGNVIENKPSYAQNAGMLLKRKGVIGNAELHATSNISNWA